jgi:hypothetical protein
MTAKDIDLSKIVLTRGLHTTREEGMNAMEAAAYLAGLEHTECPHRVCILITIAMNTWNDHLPSDRIRTRLLVPLLPTILNTRGSGEVLVRRGWMAVDWLVRVHTAAWLERSGLAAHAAALRALAPIVDVASGEASKKVTLAARAAWRKARDAALTAIKKTNRAAVSNDAMWKATRRAIIVGASTGRQAVRSCASAAGLVTADIISWDPAYDGEWIVMTRRLTRTVKTLQASAVDLLERMAAVKSAAAPAEGAGGGARTSRAARPTKATSRLYTKPPPR